MATMNSAIRKRHVFFISDLDARGATHHHALYRDEAVTAAQLLEATISVGARRQPGRIGTIWPVTAQPAQASTETTAPTPVQITYEFLRWDDIVRTHWPRSNRLLARLALQLLGQVLRTGAYRRLKKIYPGATRMLVLPGSLLLLQCVLLPLLSVAAGLPGLQLSPRIAALCFGLTATLLSVLLWQFQQRVRARWLACIGAFTLRLSRQQVPELEGRIELWATRIRQVMTRADADEILIVGHGLGSILAVRTLARVHALKSGLRYATRQPVLSLMTLGNALPLLSLLPNADRFQRDIDAVASSPDWVWFDFSDPSDAFAVTLPNITQAMTQGTDNTEAKDEAKGSTRVHQNLTTLSPKFKQMFAAERYQMLQRDPYQLHFQYLCAGDKMTDYNYFAITTGTQTLQARFASCSPHRA